MTPEQTKEAIINLLEDLIDQVESSKEAFAFLNIDGNVGGPTTTTNLKLVLTEK